MSWASLAGQMMYAWHSVSIENVLASQASVGTKASEGTSK